MRNYCLGKLVYYLKFFQVTNKAKATFSKSYKYFPFFNQKLIQEFDYFFKMLWLIKNYLI